jgi:hypothetical protein
MHNKLPLAYDRRALADITYLGSRVSNLSAVVRSQLLHDSTRWDIELKLELEKLVKIYNQFFSIENVSHETKETTSA